MKITLIAIGKTKEKYLTEGIKLYLNKLKHYCSFELIEIKDIEYVGTVDQIKEKEANQITKYIKPESTIICLDENGAQYSSESWAEQIQLYQNKSVRHLVFIIGGAYGIHHDLLTKSNLKLSLSKMTFNHEMVRLFFLEQMYRAFSIIRNEKYHNP